MAYLAGKDDGSGSSGPFTNEKRNLIQTASIILVFLQPVTLSGLKDDSPTTVSK